MKRYIKLICLLFLISNLTSCVKKNEELLCYVKKDPDQKNSFEFKYHISLDFSNPFYYYIWGKGVCRAEVEYQPNRWEYQSEGTAYLSKEHWTCNTIIFRKKGFQPKETFKINRITGTVYHITTAEKNISRGWGYCHKIKPKL